MHVALRGEIVDLVWLRVLHEADEVGRISHIAVMENEAQAGLVRIMIKMVDPPGVEGGRPAFYALNDVSLLEQEFRKVGAILPGRAGNQCHAPCCTLTLL